jgi:hypothetical protein
VGEPTPAGRAGRARARTHGRARARDLARPRLVS